MAENGEDNGAAAAAPEAGQKAPQMRILGQFIRDLSFENVLIQKGTSQTDVQPEMQVQVNLDAKKRPTDNQYEVYSKYVVSAKAKGTDQVLFLLELDYGGVFFIENVPENQLHPFLMIECPRMLFPFARRIVSDVTRDGGFPPVNLENVDFVQLYRSELARRAQAQPAEGTAPAT